MLTIRYDADRATLYVPGVRTPFPANSLEVRRLGDQLAIAIPHGGDLICAWAAYGLWDDADGIPFTSPDEAFARLTEICTRRPPDPDIETPTAATTLSGHRVVRIIGPNWVDVASRDDPAHAGDVLGVTLDAATADASVRVRTRGPLDEPSWAFAPGPAFLGVDGAITQAIPTTGFRLRIGTFTAPTRLIVALDPPILLAP